MDRCICTLPLRVAEGGFVKPRELQRRMVGLTGKCHVKAEETEGTSSTIRMQCRIKRTLECDVEVTLYEQRKWYPGNSREETGVGGKVMVAISVAGPQYAQYAILGAVIGLSLYLLLTR